MVLHRELAISLLDVLFGGIAIDAERCVVVALCHESTTAALLPHSYPLSMTNGRIEGRRSAHSNPARYYVGGNHAIRSIPLGASPAGYHFLPSLTSVNSASTTFSSPPPLPSSLPPPADDACVSACALAYIASPSF